LSFSKDGGNLDLFGLLNILDDILDSCIQTKFFVVDDDAFICSFQPFYFDLFRLWLRQIAVLQSTNLVSLFPQQLHHFWLSWVLSKQFLGNINRLNLLVHIGINFKAFGMYKHLNIAMMSE